MSKKSNTIINLFEFILGVAATLFLGAYILQLAYNNSVPEMTKDVDSNKYKVPHLNYWNAFALFVLLSFFIRPYLISFTL